MDDEDVALCCDELTKLAAILRDDEALVAEISRVVAGLLRGASLPSIHSREAEDFEDDGSTVMAPFMRVVVDSQVSGHVTAESLGSIFRLLEMGSRTNFLHNVLLTGAVVDCVTATRFMETDRLADETVLHRIIRIVEFVVCQGAPLDKARVAAGLQCIQTMWVQDTHTHALRDAARTAVFRILEHVISHGYDGYAGTLVENVCLNVEFIARQPPLLFDADKLAFFVEIVSFYSRKKSADKSAQITVSFQVLNGLFWLFAPGPAAVLVDPSSTGILQRSSASNALSVAASLLTIGNDLVRRLLAEKGGAAPVLVEGLLSGMYLRVLSPVGDAEHPSLKLRGFGENTLGQLEKRIAAQSLKMYVPETSQVHAVVLESLGQLLRKNFVLALWENFDAVWHRAELCASLVDALVGVVIGKMGFGPMFLQQAIPVLRETSGEARLDKVFALIGGVTETEQTDPAGSFSPIELQALNLIDRMIDSVLGTLHEQGGPHSHHGDSTEVNLRMRLAAKESARLIKQKPKKTAEFVSHFLKEFGEHLELPRDGSDPVPWLLRQMHALDFESLGGFFGQPTEASGKALSDFIKSLNLKAMDPEQALRACLQSFRLPGEAQQIDRIIKEIAYEYYASAGGNYFASADAAYTFLFSVIMLNTDQHNPQVKKRMELKDFLRNNRKINEGEDIPEDVQTRVFNSIRSSQIVTPKSASWFCAPLKGRWRDLAYLHESGYIPSGLRGAAPHSAGRFLAAKGHDLLLIAALALGRDPGNTTSAVAMVRKLAEAGIAVHQNGFADKCLNLLKKYAIESFATVISGIVPNARSFACLKAIFEIDASSHDALVSARALLLALHAPYALLGDSDPKMRDSWKRILSVPIVSGDSVVASAASLGGISFSLLKGLLWEQSAVTPPRPNHSSDHEDDHHTGDSMAEMALCANWRAENLRSSFVEGQPNAPSGAQVQQLGQVDFAAFIARCSAKDKARLAERMLELVAAGTTDDFWAKELVRSSPWILLFCALIGGGESAKTTQQAILSVCNQLSAGTVLSDIRGLKLTVFAVFVLPHGNVEGNAASPLRTASPHRKPTSPASSKVRSSSVSPTARSPTSSPRPLASMEPLLETLAAFGSAKLQALNPMICACIRELLVQNTCPTGAWKGLFMLLAASCPQRGAEQILKKICLETAYRILSNPRFIATVSEEQLAECLSSYEAIVSAVRGHHRVSKTLSEVACQLSGKGGAGTAWAAVLARITLRITTIANQRKPTAPELSDSVELLRMCLGDPRAVQSLTVAQAASTIEKTANALSAIVSANTPPGALQTALSVFMRFFLLSLDRLQQHPQFDHLWLTSLRIILLFIKRGHDDPAMDQLAEVTVETLRNALQVLLAANLLQFDTSDPTSPAWWKVTWESVETFCPGMLPELGYEGEARKEEGKGMMEETQEEKGVEPEAEQKTDEIRVPQPEADNEPVEPTSAVSEPLEVPTETPGVIDTEELSVENLSDTPLAESGIKDSDERSVENPVPGPDTPMDPPPTTDPPTPLKATTPPPVVADSSTNSI